MNDSWSEPVIALIYFETPHHYHLSTWFPGQNMRLHMFEIVVRLRSFVRVLRKYERGPSMPFTLGMSTLRKAAFNISTARELGRNSNVMNQVFVMFD